VCKFYESSLCSILADGRAEPQIKANAWYEALLLFLSNSAKLLHTDPPKAVETVSKKLFARHKGLIWLCKGTWVQENAPEWLYSVSLKD